MGNAGQARHWQNATRSLTKRKWKQNVENGEGKDEREEESEYKREEETLDVDEGQNQDDEDASVPVFDNIFEILSSPFVEKWF